jgi:DNA (cytosine-5)-methyltransferase 1
MAQRIASPVAVDLFAGAGGLSLGFKLAGFSVGFAVERDAAAAATYHHNHPDTVLFEADIQHLDPAGCVREASFRRTDIDAVICGLPCQGFSESNRRTRNLRNPRNHLYTEFLRFVTTIRPPFVVVENVAGMRTMARGTVIRKIVESCEEMGYAMTTFELNAADFGVPQFRRRLFLVGTTGEPLVPPEPTHGIPTRPYVTVRQAIHDLPILRSGDKSDSKRYRLVRALSYYQEWTRGDISQYESVGGNRVTKNNGVVLERFRHVRAGQNWEAIPAHLMENHRNRSLCHTGYYYRLRWEEPSKVVGNFRKNMLIHPSQNRTLSVREAARLQSFPDRYDFLGAMHVQQQQVADAVPPLLAKAVAELLVQHLVRAKVPANPPLTGAA